MLDEDSVLLDQLLGHHNHLAFKSVVTLVHWAVFLLENFHLFGLNSSHAFLELLLEVSGLLMRLKYGVQLGNFGHCRLQKLRWHLLGNRNIIRLLLGHGFAVIFFFIVSRERVGVGLLDQREKVRLWGALKDRRHGVEGFFGHCGLIHLDISSFLLHFIFAGNTLVDLLVLRHSR